jgi:hypothetical protein
MDIHIRWILLYSQMMANTCQCRYTLIVNEAKNHKKKLKLNWQVHVRVVKKCTSTPDLSKTDRTLVTSNNMTSSTLKYSSSSRIVESKTSIYESRVGCV